jgi:hypothetical protein
MDKPDLQKYALEVDAMQRLPAATVELPPLAALAIISHIQLATRHPGTEGTGFSKIAIDVAKQLQNLFNEDSETYKVLELGWNPEEDILTPSGEVEDEFCGQPCDKFLQNLGCRCTGYQVGKLIPVGDAEISRETLAAGAAMFQQIARNYSSGNIEFLDM